LENVIYISIPLLIVYVLIDQGRKLAQDYAGKMGKAFQSWGEKTVGFVAGSALGATALVGGRVVGGLAAKADESAIGRRIRDMAAKSGAAGWLGKKLQGGLNTARTGSYDVRQSTVGKTFFKNLGMNVDQKGMNVLSGMGLGLGVDQRKGGREADIKRRQERQVKNSELLEEKHADAYNARQKARHEADVDRIIDRDIAARLHITFKEVQEMKENNKTTYAAERATSTTAKQTEIDSVPPPKTIKSNEEITTARRKEYAENLAKGGFVTQKINEISKNNPRAGAFLQGAYAPIGMITGSEVRNTADKLAAKKIEEKTKISKELEEIEGTLKKGFQDLIAMDMFSTSTSFTSLNTAEQQELIKDGIISSAGPNKGKRMYDILTTAEQQAVSDREKELQKKENKDERENYEEMIKARESNKYDLKVLRQELKRKQALWVANPTDPTAKSDYLAKLKEVKNAEKQQAKFRDLQNYIKSRRDKLKGEEGK
jgi:hypothetical protein